MVEYDPEDEYMYFACMRVELQVAQLIKGRVIQRQGWQNIVLCVFSKFVF